MNLPLSLALPIALLISGPAAAQLVFSPDPEPAFEQRMEIPEVVLEPLEPIDDIDGSLINGLPAAPRDFAAVIRMTTGGTCTAAIIGPATVLLAAHCVDHGQQIRFKTGAGSVRGICDQTPGYRGGDKSQDWALCLLSNRVTGIIYETVNLGTSIGTGDEALLTGFGCRNEGGLAGQILLIGVSKIVTRPPSLRRETSTIYSHSNIDSGGAILCPGDSGGPMFRLIEGTTDGKRLLEGVNSRTTYSAGFSLFAATSSRNGKAFVTDWAEANNQTICGLNLSGAMCKGG
jgi:Trypsin